jgi:hypothetical protein
MESNKENKKSAPMTKRGFMWKILALKGGYKSKKYFVRLYTPNNDRKEVNNQVEFLIKNANNYCLNEPPFVEDKFETPITSVIIQDENNYWIKWTLDIMYKKVSFN